MIKRSREGKHLCQSGFTLLEVVIAMAILGIGLLSYVALQTTDVAYNTSSKTQSQGYVCAMHQIERLHGLDYAHGDLAIQGSSTVVGDGHSPLPAAPPQDRCDPYTVEWDVADNGANVANSKLVNVFVRWRGREVARVDYTRVQTSF